MTFKAHFWSLNEATYFITTTRHGSAILYRFTALWNAIDHSLESASCNRHESHTKANVREAVAAVAGRKLLKSDIKA